ncbi:MAG: hypothetical protein JWM00_485 [Candidatus Saccharibacteria bacterium]|nr:hypothetical protein [Candidatus Saccharibacteria bacterium]
MESGEIPEHLPTTPGAGEATGDSQVDSLPKELGFLETTELLLLRDAARDAYLAGEAEQVLELRSHYQVVGEEVVNQQHGEEYTKAQIGLLIATGILSRDVGDVTRYMSDLDDAITYAFNMDYDDVVSALESAKAQAGKLTNE